jgi:hypothetical protein
MEVPPERLQVGVVKPHVVKVAAKLNCVQLDGIHEYPVILEVEDDCV